MARLGSRRESTLSRFHIELQADQQCVSALTLQRVVPHMWGYHGGSPTAVQAWRPCPLWEPSPSHPILL